MRHSQLAKGEATDKEIKPRTGAIRIAAAFAAFLLLFGIAFFTASTVLDDGMFIETEYERLQTDQETGISIPDLSLATRALFDYMKGRRENIRISVRVDGTEVDDLFYHIKEVIHMEEVRALWRTLTIAAILCIGIAIALFAAILFFGRHNTRLRNTGAGLIIGSGTFAGLIALAGLWAVGDFNSFWTVFHFAIFPRSLIEYIAGGMTVEAYNSLNWVFDPSFAMIRILDGLFPPLVLRCAIFFAVEIAVVLAAGILLNLRGKRLDQAGSDIVEVREVQEETRYKDVADAPDLVLKHKLNNASLEQKKKLMEELRKPPEEREPEDEPTKTETESETDEA